jgi:alkanesulfonate monooxygenase SsuD/methylene tetrahydromethanopterin reductase-like flavin-dependent oxidoreductase (luciferase family)
MTFGLFCLNETYDNSVADALEHQVALVELADTLGFEEAWFGEHHFNRFSVIPDPVAMLAYAAARTRTIRLGTAGFLAPFYHPVRLAESIALLDQLSGGRIDVGFAKGGFAPDSRHLLDSPADQRNLMFESVDLVRQLLETAPVSHDGTYHRLEAITLAPRPLQERLPFYIATFASEATIRFAAERGYGLMLSQGASLKECIEVQAYYRSIAGHDPEIVLLRMLCIAQTSEAARSEMLPAVDHFVRSMQAAQKSLPQPRFDREHYDALLRERSAFFNGERFVENAICGTAAECLETVKTFHKELSHVHLALKPASPDPERNREILTCFAREVRPHVTSKGIQ